MTKRELVRIALLVAILALSHSAESLASSSKAPAISKESAYDLRPTQPVVGYASVELKSKLIRHMSKSERIEYLRDHPVPVVIGPDLNYYLIDHHHLTRAVIETGHKWIYIQVVADLSHLTKDDFWLEMQHRKYLYLYDAFGNEITPDELPHSIVDLQDDPYRSLAYFARKEGAFVKSGEPFAEFRWAAFYRDVIPLARLRDWKNATADAVFISRHNDAALSLPGALGRKLICPSAFAFHG